MNEDIEFQLRRALRPIDAPPGFTERVMRALPESAPRVAVATVTALRPAPRAAIWWRLSTPVALAASFIVAILIGQHVGMERTQREQRAGLAASRELMQALRVTSKKLDLAYQAVKTPPATADVTEENRS
jgi:hypothetical protein